MSPYPSPPYRPQEPGSPPPLYPSLSSSRPRLFWMLCLLFGLIGLLILPSIVEHVQYAATRGQQQAKAEAARKLLAEGDLQTRYRAVVQAIEPSVVGVKTTRVIRGQVDELSFLFGRPRLFRARGQGSGVIVDESGYIITNAHVVDQASKVVVELSDGRTIEAVEIVGTDPATDVAVLKINAGGLTAAPWGDSEALQVGDPVMAIGSPFGLARSVTAGIISGKRRRGIVQNLSYEDFLQTDAAVNPGNSGGPLVNMKGEVVGINTAILGHSFQGISFAIPSKLAKEVYEKVKTSGEVARGYLGVELQEVDASLARQLQLPEVAGALVAQVSPGSPADRAGILAGDVIVRWNDQLIDDPAELGFAVARTKIGSKASVELIRRGTRKTLTVTVGRRPAESALLPE